MQNFGKSAQKKQAVSGSQPHLALPSLRATHGRGARKGQTLSIDFIFSSSFFLLSVLFLLLVWGSLLNRIVQERASVRLEQSATFAISSLVETTGDPANWESIGQNQTKAIGLSSERGVLSNQKLAALQSYNIIGSNASQQNYTQVKQILGIGDLGVHMQVVQNNSTVFDFGEPRHAKNENITYDYVVSRQVIYNSSLAQLTLEVWK